MNDALSAWLELWDRMKVSTNSRYPESSRTSNSVVSAKYIYGLSFRSVLRHSIEEPSYHLYHKLVQRSSRCEKRTYSAPHFFE
jgi:hypothetical protein